MSQVQAAVLPQCFCQLQVLVCNGFWSTARHTSALHSMRHTVGTNGSYALKIMTGGPWQTASSHIAKPRCLATANHAPAVLLFLAANMQQVDLPPLGPQARPDMRPAATVLLNSTGEQIRPCKTTLGPLSNSPPWCVTGSGPRAAHGEWGRCFQALLALLELQQRLLSLLTWRHQGHPHHTSALHDNRHSFDKQHSLSITESSCRSPDVGGLSLHERCCPAVNWQLPALL